MSTTPRIYVACLASYNAGRLHGAWIDAAQDLDDVWSEINAMLRASPEPNVEVTCPDCEGGGTETPEGGLAAPGDTATLSGPLTEPCATCKGKRKIPSAEEWAIHDYEGFEGINLGEYEAMDRVVSLANVLDSLSGDEPAAFAAWWNNDHRNGDGTDWESDFREAYRGTYRTIEDYAEEVISEIYDLDKILPAFLAGRINWAGVARDMELGGDIWTTEGGDGVFVFDNTI